LQDTIYQFEHAHGLVQRIDTLEKKTATCIRVGNGTREITDPVEKQKYIAQRWTGAPVSR
jgi:hypothetical protein